MNDCNIFKGLWIAILIQAPFLFIVLDLMGVLSVHNHRTNARATSASQCFNA